MSMPPAPEFEKSMQRALSKTFQDHFGNSESGTLFTEEVARHVLTVWKYLTEAMETDALLKSAKEFDFGAAAAAAPEPADSDADADASRASRGPVTEERKRKYLGKAVALLPAAPPQAESKYSQFINSHDRLPDRSKWENSSGVLLKRNRSAHREESTESPSPRTGPSHTNRMTGQAGSSQDGLQDFSQYAGLLI